VNFAGLVANVIVDSTTERILLKQGGASPALPTRQIPRGDLPDEFSQLRTALKPFVAAISTALFLFPTQIRRCRRKTSRARVAAMAWTCIRLSARMPTAAHRGAVRRN